MFYVYTLTDPRDAAVFYVGKGKGDRIDAHEREAKAGVSSPKCNKIREILTSGAAVVKARVAWFDDESAAYQFEAELIEKYYGQLTNRGRITRKDEAKAARFGLFAIAVRALAGHLRTPNANTRPFGFALHKALLTKAEDIIRKIAEEFPLDELQAGVRPLGIEICDGR